MSINDIYSKRNRRAEDVPKPLTFSPLPSALIEQIIMIWQDALGKSSTGSFGRTNWSWQVYDKTVQILRREYGETRLFPNRSSRYDPESELRQSFRCPNVSPHPHATDRQLDAIEVMFHQIAPPPKPPSPSPTSHSRYISVGSRPPTPPPAEYAPKIGSKAALDELNGRFREHGIGYRFERAAGIIIRIDSEIEHAVTTAPAMTLLHDPLYTNAEVEFRQAHMKYRAGETEDALVWAGKALESTLKIICTKRGWKPNDNSKNKKVASLTAAPLISICIENELIPSSLLSQYGAVRALLEGTNTPRNKMGAHGQGVTERTVPSYLAAYGMAMAASSIVLIVKAEKALPFPHVPERR